jgi:hypothetical protein
MNKHIALFCSVLTLAACGSDNTNNTTPDAATTSDATPADGTMPDGSMTADASPADASMMTGCYNEMSAMPVCPRPAIMHADAMRPSFRVAHIRITAPAALSSAILLNTVNNAIHSGNFLWGITFDLGMNMVRTGALNTMTIMRGSVGQGLIDGTFQYYSGNAPAMGGAANRWDPMTSSLMVMGDRVTSGTFMGTVRLPIFDASGALLTELPLENATMRNVQLAGDRRCIGALLPSGGRINECTGNWETNRDMMPHGIIEAVITVSAARMVRVSALNTTLCNLLAGVDCDNTPQMMWRNQPDAMVGGMPGYRLTTEFAAISARIQ